MPVVKQATDVVAALAPRVSVVIKADLRPGVTGAMTAKVDTIERYLGQRQPLTLGPALVMVMRRMTRWSRSMAAR
jgi:hypothetical protein